MIIQVAENAAVDANSNGVDDSIDQSQESFVLQSDADGRVLETEATLSLRLGETAIYAGADSSRINLQELQDLGDSGQPANAQTDFSFNGDLFDFVIDGLSKSGQSVSIVLPLVADIPENAVYRKYTVASGWNDFVIDDNNKIASTRTVENICPAPGSDSYQDGLVTGNNCLELTIEDGGPNDADGIANSVIRDPGGVGVSASQGGSGGDNGGDNNSSSSGGGGAIGLMYLFTLMLLFGMRICRQKSLTRNGFYKKTKF